MRKCRCINVSISQDPEMSPSANPNVRVAKKGPLGHACRSQAGREGVLGHGLPAVWAGERKQDGEHRRGREGWSGVLRQT